VVSVKTTKEDTMTTTLVDYRAKMAELHVDDLLREAAAARKVQAARAARRHRGV
jgi:outer membrane murein-binding lipoprotein Lpp